MIPPRVDAHHHVWQLARGDYGWLTPDLKPIYRDFGLADVEPHLAAAGIRRTILVQAAPTEAETRFMLDVARASGGLVAGVVGWCDLAAGAAAVDALAEDPLLVGLRPMIHDIPDPDWMLQPALDPALRRMAERGLVFDALVRPVHLDPLRRFLDRHPDLTVVIDHGAKPKISAARMQPWADRMADIARDGRAWCKLSGLVTEAAKAWTVDDLRPYVDHLLACFGPERLIWGSDWPVVDLAGGYDSWWAATEALLGGIDPADRDRILGGNAIAAYGLAAA